MSVPTISVELSADVVANLVELARRCTEADEARGGATTHGALDDPSQLLVMLAEDAAMVIRRPGSWEATGMAQQFTAHGYEV